MTEDDYGTLENELCPEEPEESMTNEEIRASRLKVILEDCGYDRITELFDEEQYKKLEKFVSELATDEQIDELYFDIVG